MHCVAKKHFRDAKQLQECLSDAQSLLRISCIECWIFFCFLTPYFQHLTLLHLLLWTCFVPGGAGSEVWNRVYMIAPVKKFGRVRLSTIFPQNKYGGESRHGGTMSFCSVLSFPASKHQEKVFKNIFNGILDIRRRDVWTVHGWLHVVWFGISASSVFL